MAFRTPNPSKSRSVVVILLAAGMMVTGYGLFSPARAEHEALPAYDGSKTCNECHADKALEVHGSVHYQWQGPTPGVPNLGGKLGGKWGSINDFCTYPNINFLFQMTQPGATGATVVTGCGSCHAGMGLPPSPTADQAQLENIDCLMCHSDLYKRVGNLDANNKPVFVIDSTLDVGVVTAAIQKTPSRATCLTRCHVSAGGGPGFKQGDIDPLQIDPPRELDVHMASKANGGAGLSCLGCHTVTHHRFAGRGNDIRPTESSVRMDCSTSTCHRAHSHDSADQSAEINRHMTRVHCTVCHIPSFARNAPTDVFRDFTKTEFDSASKRYEPVRTLVPNVRPVYSWFNNLSYFYEFGTSITLQSLGRYLLAYPLGDITDSSAKIHAFKLHQAKVGYDLGGRRQIPVKSKVLWETGNVDQAFRQGAAEVGWNISGYSFATAQRYFSLYHEVPPAIGNALQCADCHVSTGRLDFKALGYGVRTQNEGKPLCASCHEAPNQSPDFYQLHARHVDEESISCTTCHTFKTAPLLPRGGINGVYLLLE
jgi:hypothetical protein